MPATGSARSGKTARQAPPPRTFLVIHTFGTESDDGGHPETGVVEDAAGNLIGTTDAGGTFGCGQVYLINTLAQYFPLHDFTCSDGYDPNQLMLDRSGEIYGTTYLGGGGGYGVLYKLDEAGNFSVLYNFCSVANCTDGAAPLGRLRIDPQGNLYGTTSEGGSLGGGIVFKFSQKHGTLTVLHDFDTTTGFPGGGLAYSGSGAIYGTTLGGQDDQGMLFELDEPSGNYTVLHDFNSGGDGAEPFGELLLGKQGQIFGTTAGGASCGILYLMYRGYFFVLHQFTGGADGCNPLGGVAAGEGGVVYGVTQEGGADNYGTVFSFDSGSHFTTLYSFTDGSDGGLPQGLLYRDSFGTLFGTAVNGGYNENGTLWELLNNAGQRRFVPITARR